MTNISKRDSIDIETSGGTVVLKLHGRSTLDIVIRGDAAADYEIDVRGHEDENWMQSVGTAYSGSADYDDTIDTGAAWVRVRCTTGTATAGDAADVLLSAGGG